MICHVSGTYNNNIHSTKVEIYYLGLKIDRKI